MLTSPIASSLGRLFPPSAFRPHLSPRLRLPVPAPPIFSPPVADPLIFFSLFSIYVPNLLDSWCKSFLAFSYYELASSHTQVATLSGQGRVTSFIFALSLSSVFNRRVIPDFTHIFLPRKFIIA